MGQGLVVACRAVARAVAPERAVYAGVQLRAAVHAVLDSPDPAEGLGAGPSGELEPAHAVLLVLVDDVLDGYATGAVWGYQGRGDLVGDGPAVAEDLVGAAARLGTRLRAHRCQKPAPGVDHNTVSGLAAGAIRRFRARQPNVQVLLGARLYQPRIGVAEVLEKRNFSLTTPWGPIVGRFPPVC